MRSETANPMLLASSANQPVRAKENSPLFQRWVKRRSQSSPVRDGRKRHLACGFRTNWVVLESRSDGAKVAVGFEPTGINVCLSLRRGATIEMPRAVRRRSATQSGHGHRHRGLKPTATVNPPLRGWTQCFCVARRGSVRRGRGSVGQTRGLLSSLRDLAGWGGGSPALKRWAIVGRPDGLVSAANALYTRRESSRGVTARPTSGCKLEK